MGKCLLFVGENQMLVGKRGAQIPAFSDLTFLTVWVRVGGQRRGVQCLAGVNGDPSQGSLHQELGKDRQKKSTEAESYR